MAVLLPDGRSGGWGYLVQAVLVMAVLLPGRGALVAGDTKCAHQQALRSHDYCVFSLKCSIVPGSGAENLKYVR
jgi:hypothetical protein